MSFEKIFIYYHPPLFKKAFKSQKSGRTLILELRTVHKIDEIEQGLLWGSTGGRKEQLPRVRRQGHASFSAIEWLGDRDTLPYLSGITHEEVGWNRGSGSQPTLRADGIGSLR